MKKNFIHDIGIIEVRIVTSQILKNYQEKIKFTMIMSCKFNEYNKNNMELNTKFINLREKEDT